jgi:ssDNA-binding Zn-finger/Zn-ribbon topoisomerase 1
MVIRYSKRGPFMGCSHYPKCKNTSEVPAKLLEELGLDGASGTQAAPVAPMPEDAEHHDQDLPDVQL